jgi:hypothetical protein
MEDSYQQKPKQNSGASLEDASSLPLVAPAPGEQVPSTLFPISKPGTLEVLGESDLSLDKEDPLSPAQTAIEDELLNSPSSTLTSDQVDDATKRLQDLKVKKPNLSRSQKKAAMMARLQERGEAWDPARWAKKKRRKAPEGSGVETPVSSGNQNAGAKGAKRSRSEKATPPSAEGPTKKHRGVDPELKGDQPQPSYRDSAATKMAVVLEGYPEAHLTEEQGDAIELAIIMEICPFEDGSAPSFAGSYMEKGALIVSCLNDATKNWLGELIPKLKPLGDEHPIKVGLRKDILRSFRVFFRAHPKLLKVAPEKVLEMLDKQNPALRVKDWKVLSSKADPKGYGFVCYLDEVCFNSVRAANYRANLGLWQVTLLANAPKDDAKGSSDQPAA